MYINECTCVDCTRARERTEPPRPITPRDVMHTVASHDPQYGTSMIHRAAVDDLLRVALFDLQGWLDNSTYPRELRQWAMLIASNAEVFAQKLTSMGYKWDPKTQTPIAETAKNG
jgi:hypothetical protein